MRFSDPSYYEILEGVRTGYYNIYYISHLIHHNLLQMLDFFLDDLFNIDCDMIVVPISTIGTMSESFHSGVRKISSHLAPLKAKYNLGEVEIQPTKHYPVKYIVFACVVEDSSSSYGTIRQIGKNLGKELQAIKDVLTIATPIIGTGAGGLNHFPSRNILLNAFYETAPNSISFNFCTPDKSVHDSFDGYSLDIDTPSGQLVFEAELGRVLEIDYIESLIYDQDYYYELALQKYFEFRNFVAPHESFYYEIENACKKSRPNYKEFLLLFDESSEEYKFLLLCGELIAYIDYRAYRKNLWNKYPDKRTLAHSAVRQSNWLFNLIKLKLTGSFNGLSTSIKNALLYFEKPETSLIMLSMSHRERVFLELLHVKYEGEKSIIHLLDFFSNHKVSCKNSMNFGALCSRILYSPAIKSIWFEEVRFTVAGRRNDELLNTIDLAMAINRISENLKTKSPKLDLGNCGLRDLNSMPELFECTHLEELILSNEWAEYENGKWRKRISNNKGKHNSLNAIPDKIGELINLKRLTCGGDWNNGRSSWNRWSIKNLSAIIRLQKLEYLNVSNNMLTTIKGLNQLKKLTVAHLNNNEISVVESLTDVEYLEELYLSNNNIRTVIFLQPLKNIKTIDLHQNDIRDLRPLEELISKIGIENNKWKIDTLNIAQNPLEYPALDIVNLGKEAVLSTLQDIKKLGRYINKDIKVILVGNSEAGKSTLVKYLDAEKYLDKKHGATLWMAEKTIKSKYKIELLGDTCTLHLFDFGGHDYYHDTHQLFYSSNTIYILLWDAKTNELAIRNCVQEDEQGKPVDVEVQDYPVKYWLESVKHYIQDIEADNFEFDIQREKTYNSSLLMIQNKVGKADQLVHLNNAYYTEHFPFIYDMINISIIDPRRNLLHFDSILGEMLNNMSIIGASLPKYYETIKKAISIYQGAEILNIEQFLSFCNSLLKTHIDISQCRIMCRYLEQIGVILYSYNAQEEKVYLKKENIIKSIHQVLSDLVDKKGEFDLAYVSGKLEKSTEAADLIAIMKSFKMIFSHPYQDIYIAPLYLPKLPEGKVKLFLNDKIKPYRRFEYSGFIHKNVVLSVFDKYTKMIAQEKRSPQDDLFYYWKDGLIVKKPSSDEIVMIKFHLGNNEGNACIDVFDMAGGEKNHYVFLKEVISFIKEVNHGYPLEEMVTIDGVHYISIEILNQNARIGKWIFSERKKTDYTKPREAELYFELKNYKMYLTEDVKKKKVVISYSKFDLDQVNLFTRYLRPLIDRNLIDVPWCCEELLPGEIWDEKIKTKFDEADIVFFMVSADFFSTQYILDHEIKGAIDRYDNDKNSVKIIPIILKYYDWGRIGKYDLQRFSALPFKGKPVSDFGNSDIVWHAISTSVRMMIEKDLDPINISSVNREIQGIFERQILGKLDNNS